MIALIDYGAGNVASVQNALSRLGTGAVLTHQVDVLEMADAVIFPGVGHAAPAMESLRASGLDIWLKSTRKPVLGICLGMQLLYESTEEGNTACLGIIPGRLQKFSAEGGKIPHMGWNTTTPVVENGLPAAIQAAFHYYVHSFYAPVNEFTVATCNYGVTFAAIVAKDNFTGVQFHPEKSGLAGQKILRQFIEHHQITAG